MDLDRLFGEAQDQDEGSYWSAHSEQDRTIKAAESIVAGLREASRKFGISGVIVEAADGRRVQVFRLTAVQCVHRSAPGTISAVFRFCWIVALLDGLAILGLSTADYLASMIPARAARGPRGPAPGGMDRRP